MKMVQIENIFGPLWAPPLDRRLLFNYNRSSCFAMTVNVVDMIINNK